MRFFLRWVSHADVPAQFPLSTKGLVSPPFATSFCPGKLVNNANQLEILNTGLMELFPALAKVGKCSSSGVSLLWLFRRFAGGTQRSFRAPN